MLFLYILIFLILISVAYTTYSLAPWVPSFKKDFPRICNLANFKENDKFYDLGCGNGSLVLYAGKYYPIKAIGLELSIPLYLFCKIKQIAAKNATFKFQNILYANFSDADVVYLFPLWKNTIKKLKTKMETELKRGTRVITYTFPIEGWIPEKIDKPTDKDLSVYLYIIE
ncbi:class I SAM-dependent methyltransferase [Candidatus Parcubacteria bacterium]|nr:class I SAM-dependent methyltransferase [Patescibacteria group bacterium]MBU4309602.1 class I SAM-dependent methyltransferase [Patescibacteria group bacterium]MBU4432330.1 class I SAM-dependent methyltransferase [Patescibacteria group bacterium]MBU4578010.1 class I SAM-dependent methyltransferase [Patescibacteria group bacterium]MCG2696482.1 class I SAM-dependent methyltransferase [Candidatus Parcubacteria bacterium]